MPALGVRGIVASLDEGGFDTNRMLAAAGLQRSLLDEPFAIVPTPSFDALVHIAAGDLDVAQPTRLGLSVPPHAMGLYDHLIYTGSTWREVFLLSQRYRGLISQTTSLSLVEGRSTWLWFASSASDGGTQRAELVEYQAIAEQWSLASVFARCRYRFPSVAIEEVHFTTPDTGNSDLLARHWGVPVRLGMPRAGIRYAKNAPDTPNFQANPNLQATLRRILDREEVRLWHTAPIANSFRTDLLELFARGVSTINGAAAELGYSRRSLQRRLSQADISFRALLNTYRRETAFAMLHAGDRNVNEIAYSLGYSGETALNRAFHRWTGLSPTEWVRLELDRRA